jgi:2-oxoisovalerate dehydrogenase E2 component (dihydrolipoyl transacylase)
MEFRVVRWFVGEGEHVSQHQRLVEVITDHATVEIPAPSAGRVTAIVAAAGELVRIDQPLCQLDPDCE